MLLIIMMMDQVHIINLGPFIHIYINTFKFDQSYKKNTNTLRCPKKNIIIISREVKQIQV